jgi:hypothetical protein
MKINFKHIILTFFLLTLVSCSENYFDVNTPSGTATEGQLSMSALLAPVEFNTVKAQYWAERSLGNYTQNFTGQGGGAIGQTSLSSTWSSFYLHSLPNLNVIIAKAQANGATHFEAVAKILIAINLGLVTDSWDNIPYSQAAQSTENLKPAFDLQETIYNDIDSLLSEAITALSAPDTSGFAIESDLIYGGDASKWLKAAHTLRARYQLHLSEKNGVTAASNALASLANGFTSNADDFQLGYPGEIKNPWHVREVLAPNTGNDHDKVGDQLVSYMNGTSYPYTTITMDPRLPIYADKEGDAANPYRGYVSGGDGLSSDGNSANTNFADDGFYTKETSPLVVISYAEAMFIKAEAEFLVNGGNATSVGSNANAYDAYMDGIQANMNKLGVDGTAYMADASIDLGSGNLMLQHIMKEKYIANFLNPETFVDFRRYDFSTNVFKDLALPVDNADGEFPGEWLVRAQYPSSESVRNPDNVNANKKSPTERVWWDE